MGDLLAAALSGRAWTLTGLLAGPVDDLHDDEGRPLGERRASSAAKRGVPMVLAACPYEGARQGLPMNVSALTQVKRYLKPVLEDVARFHALGATQQGWQRMLPAVLDQLAAPAVHLLRGGAAANVPAQKAVGYKLAAGYFGALRRLLAAEARGAGVPATVEDFQAWLERERLLVGASEVCGGPPALIAFATGVFLEGLAGAQPVEDRSRHAVANLLSQQVQLGLAWELFDGAAEARLLRTLIGPHLLPRTSLLADELAERLVTLEAQPAFEAAERALPPQLAPATRDALAAAVRCFDIAPDTDTPATAALVALAARREGPFSATEPSAHERVARHFATWLDVRGKLARAQCALEHQLRGVLGREPAGPVKPSPLMMAPSQAQRWFEAVLGHTLLAQDAGETTHRLHSIHRTVTVPA